jgi:hypothetical protein
MRKRGKNDFSVTDVLTRGTEKGIVARCLCFGQRKRII